jgi:hypothetical protein
VTKKVNGVLCVFSCAVREFSATALNQVKENIYQSKDNIQQRIEYYFSGTLNHSLTKPRKLIGLSPHASILGTNSPGVTSA